MSHLQERSPSCAENHALKCGQRSTDKTKGHWIEFIQSYWSDECSFLLICLFQWHLPMATLRALWSTSLREVLLLASSGSSHASLAWWTMTIFPFLSVLKRRHLHSLSKVFMESASLMQIFKLIILCSFIYTSWSVAAVSSRRITYKKAGPGIEPGFEDSESSVIIITLPRHGNVQYLRKVTRDKQQTRRADALVSALCDIRINLQIICRPIKPLLSFKKI